MIRHLHKYIFYILIIFLVSCNSKEQEINLNNETETISMDSAKEEQLIEQTTDEDIDELIDILFETNN